MTNAYTLHPYQVKLIDRARIRLAQGFKRVLLQSAVGSGKTVVTSEIVKHAVAKGKRVLFLAHRRRLIEQKSEKLTEFGIQHGILMNGVEGQRYLPVQVASRDTLLSRTVRNEWVQPPPADLVIVDEAHRAMSEEYQKLLAMYPEAYHIGVTATPAREDGRGLGDFYQVMECGPPISELIKGGFLCGIRCYAPMNSQHGKSKTKRVVCGDPVYNWQLFGENRSTIVFAGTVEGSRAVADSFNRSGIAAEHMDAHTENRDRKGIIARIKSGQTKILCNCAIATEGVDIPILSCCQLLRTARSYVLFAQTVGRIMRTYPGKTHGILIDHSDAILEHGFPDEDARWTLERSETIEQRNKKDRKEGKHKEPIVCPKCGFIYSGMIVCPSCHYALPKKLIPPVMKQQILKEVQRNLPPIQQQLSKERFWRKCLAIAANKNLPCSAALAMYRKEFSEWPSDDLPDVPRRSECHRKASEVFPHYVRGNV